MRIKDIYWMEQRGKNRMKLKQISDTKLRLQMTAGCCRRYPTLDYTHGINIFLTARAYNLYSQNRVRREELGCFL